MRFQILAFVIFVLASPVHSFAAGNAGDHELLRFFRPLQAEVIMPLEGGILIDRGGSDQIAPGDIFVSVSAEKVITHPQTGVQLDTLREYGGLFEVTRVKAELAYCSPLDNLPLPPAGAKMRRFENVPLSFESTAEDRFQKFRTLREQLPHLRWQDYRAATGAVPQSQLPALVIQDTGRRLQVRDHHNRILLEVTYSSATETAATPPLPATNPEPPPALSTVTANDLKRIALPRGQEIEALRLVDLDRDGALEAILCYKDELVIGTIDEGTLAVQSRVTLTGPEQIIQVSALDLDQDNHVEIVVSALKDNEPYSIIYAYDGKLLREITSSQLLLGSFTPAGATEILLGMNKDDLLKARAKFYRITLRGGKIEKSAFTLSAARQVFGLTAITDTQGDALLVQLDPNNKLKVSNAGGEPLWQGSDNFGGSMAYFKIRQPGARNTADEEKLFLKSALKRTPTQTLLVAKHSGANLFKNSPADKDGQLAELKWNGFTLEQIGISAKLGGRIADFDQADLDRDGKPELIAAVVYQAKGLFSKPVSGLVIIPNHGR